MKMGTLVVAFGAIENTMSQRKKSLKPKPPHGRAAGSGSGGVPSAFGWQLLVTGGLRVGAAGLGASMAELAGAWRGRRAGVQVGVQLGRASPNMVRKSRFVRRKK